MKRRMPGVLDRLDRKLGRLWARMCGTIATVAGIGALLSLLAVEDFSLATYWPVLGFAALLLGLARICFRSKEGLLDQLSEWPNDRPPKPAARPPDRRA